MNSKVRNFVIALVLIAIWCVLIFVDANRVTITPQIIYGQTVIETETEAPYSEDDLYLLSHLICGEVEGCDRQMKTYVGSVVLNRVADSRFPGTLREVIYQSGQYSCTWDGNFEKTPGEETIDVAKFLLTNGSQLPPKVIFQAEFKQGTGVYGDPLVAPNGVTMYFCTG